MTNSIGVLKRTRPSHMVAIQQKIWTPLGMAIMTAGIAKHTMKLVTSKDQTNSGIFCSDIPGARCFRIVQMVLTAIASEESSVNVIICAQKSTRFPEEYCGPESGT